MPRLDRRRNYNKIRKGDKKKKIKGKGVEVEERFTSYGMRYLLREAKKSEFI